MVSSTKIGSVSVDLQLKRSKFRHLLLENLDKRYLMASDAGAVFAPGTPMQYVDQILGQLTSAGGANQANPVARWTTPVGGVSPTMGSPATVSWSIVPDGTMLPGLGGADQPSNLVSFLDGIYGGGSGPLSNRPWFQLIDRAYKRWSDISGLEFRYESNDDGIRSAPDNRGVLGVRGDVRIGGRALDGDFGVLAFNFFPNSGGAQGADGDMVIDTNDAFYRLNAENPSAENRAFFNVLMHEAGHGIGLGHVIPVLETKLMEPFVSTAFLGPQHDDFLGVQTLYGDNAEEDDTVARAVDLGTLGNGVFSFSDRSINGTNDSDFASFTVASAGNVSVEVRPIGFSYSVGPQGGPAALVDSLLNKDLSFTLFKDDGTVLASVNAGGMGVTELLRDFALPSAGGYRLQIDGAGAETQLYEMTLRISGITTGVVTQRAPHLLSVAANSGEIFDINLVNNLKESPRELVFRFDGSQVIDPSSFSGIRIYRSGGDGRFGDDKDVVIVPAYVGYGDNERIIVMRFASPLPDDAYRIEVLGVDLPSENRNGIRNSEGALLRPRRNGTDRDTFFMNIELGAQVRAVVPQPVDVVTKTQARDKIDVYFNDDDLDVASVTNPAFYKLILTKDTVTPNDDQVFAPTSVTYDPAADKAVLTFGSNIDVLAGGAGTFRLRVGSNEQVAQLGLPSVIFDPNLDQTTDVVGDTLNSAFDLSTTLSDSFSAIIRQTVKMPDTAALPDYPGGLFEPGKRDIDSIEGNTADAVVGQTHLNSIDPVNNILDARRDQNVTTLADNSPLIKSWTYSFALDKPYGTAANGRPLFTSISSDQITRIREIFDFYSAQLGVDFQETTGIADFTIVVGDLAPLNKQSGVDGTLAASDPANRGLAILDQAEQWDNGFGNGSKSGKYSFFLVAMHEIGHLLGLGYAYEQPAGTVMGGFEMSSNAQSVPEWFFPGNVDVNHGKHIYRPDNKDVDIYSFRVAAGTTGRLNLETVAERLNDASNVDTHLTLMKRVGNGFEIVALNDNYFSKDSAISVDVAGDAGTGSEYFIAVTARGNSDFNPLINGTGGGATSSGKYELRMNFRPNNASFISDKDGTALDGDGDGIAGGNFNFWFRAATPAGPGVPTTQPRTLFVDKDYRGATVSGSLAQPFKTISAAVAASKDGDIVRVLGTRGVDGSLSSLGDNPAYEIGDGGAGKGVLADGKALDIPKGVTMMIDAGAIFKLASSGILAGSSDASTDRSASSLQVLGTPATPVFFTSHFDQSMGVDTNLLNTTPTAGDWGGLEFRLDNDRAQGRRDREREGVFLNYVGYADIQFGGGLVGQGTQSRVVNAISMTETRPTLLYNTIRNNADAGISADPNSFEETTFSEPRYHVLGEFFTDYNRVGPVIRGNAFSNNSLNALQIRIDTLPGAKLKPLEVAGRIDDTDVTYVLGENLVIQGQPGGNVLETVRPNVSLVTVSGISGGTLAAGNVFNYLITNVDRFGAQGLSSLPTGSITVGAGGGVRLANLPAATGDFVGRQLWRSQNGGAGPYVLIAELNKGVTDYRDLGTEIGGSFDPFASGVASLERARRDASLVIDPGVVIKSLGARIEVGIGATLLAEGTGGKPIVFTSRLDDRFGAGGTFDTNNDGADSDAAAGNWGGIVARHLSTLSIDSSLITFAGGGTTVPGGSATFSAVEVHQANVRIANSTLENNASGALSPSASNRDSRGPNDASVIYVVGSQPVIVNNIIRDNSDLRTAAISIDASSLNGDAYSDYGRSTGLNNRVSYGIGNRGALIQQNHLGNNGLNGMRVRSGTLTTESVWDDTDIVHVVEGTITIPNFTTYGGLLLKSNVNESLVVKLNGASAGFVAAGLPLDIQDRIGGSLQIVGSPGFPVYLTDLFDDSIGAGFDVEGNSQVDTDGTGRTIGRVGGWRGVTLDATSNDRNVDTTFELEANRIQDRKVNDIPDNAQDIGALASTLRGGDENLRLGITLHGTIAAGSDMDVYKFSGTAGTMVWIDIDRSSGSLDSIVELIDVNGNVIAGSDNSFTESQSRLLEFPATGAERALVMDSDAFAYKNALRSGANSAQIDFQGINPLDAGFRVVLPGESGSSNPYYVRVRSSNRLASGVFDPNELGKGVSTGAYRLQLRLQQRDEIGGSTVRYADIRFATRGIELLGMPGHSPLLGEYGELPSSAGGDANETSGNAQFVGNVANSDRAELSLAAGLGNRTDIDWFRFTAHRDAVQQENSSHISTVFDLDYADGLGRADTTLWVYRQTPLGLELVLLGTDSNIADDQAAPGLAANEGDLSRGSFGTRDPFIGASELPDGTYFVAVSNSSFADQQLSQYTSASSASPNFRLEPVNGFQRYSEDRFDTPAAETAIGPKAVSFGGTANAVPFTLADVTLYVSQRTGNGSPASRLWYGNAKTGAAEANVSGGNTYDTLVDIAVAPDGSLVGFENLSAQGTDALAGTFRRIDSNDTGDEIVGFTPVNSGIQTFFADFSNAPPTVGNSDVGMVFTSLTFSNNTGQLGLFATASRGDGSDTYSGFNDARNSSRNVLYRIDADTLEAVSPLDIDYTDNDQASDWGGTQIVPYGWFDTLGTITGLAEVLLASGSPIIPDAATMFAVSNRGELFALPTGNTFDQQWGEGIFISTIQDPVTNRPIAFTSLTGGPRNLQGGRFAEMLFGVTATGRLYAFNAAGQLQPIFPQGATFIDMDPNLGGPDTATALRPRVEGIDFSVYDQNLWHVTNSASDEPGHGVPSTFDGSRQTDGSGGNSLYFGLDGAFFGGGRWGGSYTVAEFADTYNVPGGTTGAIESNRIDLRGYSSDDQPMLYFNYNVETETSNSSSDDAIIMRDSFRVYAATPDGTWTLLATNNTSNDGNFLNGNNEYDNALGLLTNYQDTFGKTYKPQEIFDTGETGYSGDWRQARISLAPFAGLDNVRLRFEFSTQGDARSGDTVRGGQEITAIDPALLVDGDTFTVTDAGGNDFTFEFDLGLVLNMPGGASIPNGSVITVEGQQFTFLTATAGGANEVIYASGMTPTQVAAAFRQALEAAGFTVFTNSLQRNVLNVKAGATAGGLHDIGVGLDPNIIIGRPGVSLGTTSVDINQEYPLVAPFNLPSKDQAIIDTRDAIRVSLASRLNRTGQETNVDVWDVYGNTIQLFNFQVTDLGKLGGLAAPRRGDTFESEPGFASRDQRAQNNAFRGVFVDDIVIGFAERGEMARFYTNAAEPTFGANSLLTSGGLPFQYQFVPANRVAPIETGTYQLNIRTAADYGVTSGGSLGLAQVGRTFDTNDRLAKQVAIEVANPGGISDGQSFTLSDGYNEAVFEFDVVTSIFDPASGVQTGRIPIVIDTRFSVSEVAAAIRDAINSDTAQSILKITASTTELTPFSNSELGLSRADVQLHGNAALSMHGDMAFPAALAGSLSMKTYGGDTLFGEDLGDSNRLRDQGQVVISSTVVRDSAGFGIVVDASNRQRTDLADNSGARAYPGSPRNLVTLNNLGLAPGVVLVNNIIDRNRLGGILVSGDSAANQPNAPVSIARILNNTIVGNTSGSVGISIEQGASPDILNNILSQHGVAISADALSNSTILSANIYKGNAVNVQGVSLNEDFAFVLSASDPLFVNAGNGRYIPAPGSKAIDSSLASLEERPALAQVKNGVRLPVSPTVAPNRDIGGLIRADDPLVNTPSGQGQTVFIDRGAVDRADSKGPIAVLQNPLDNDVFGQDVDASNTYVRLTSGNLSYFSVLLNEDQGTGPDSSTVTAESVILTENGRLLLPGIDYVFAYSVNSREIRLTPFSGLWRRDSVYEITLVNRPSFRVDATNGASVVDGDKFTLQPIDGSVVHFEYDSGFVMTVPQTYTLLVPPTGAGVTGILDGQRFRIQNGLVDVEFEFDTDGNIQAGSRAVPIPPVATATEVRDAILAVLTSSANADLNLAPKAVGTDRISLGTLSVHRVTITSAKLNLEGGFDGVQDGQSFTVTRLGKPTQTFEFNLQGDANISGGATAITIVRSDNYEDIAKKIAASLSPVFSGGFAPVASYPGGIVHIGGNVGDTLAVTSSKLTLSGTPGVETGLTWTVPSAGGAAIADGAQFSIRIGAVTRLFEFTTDLASTPGTRPISIRNTDTASTIATKIITSIRNAGLGITPTAAANVITLNEPLGTVADVLTSGLVAAGLPGGAVAVPFVPSSQFNPKQMAGQITRAVNSVGLSVRALATGDYSVLIDGISAINGVNAKAIGAITDYASNLLQPNRTTARTQFTIVMPNVTLDYGDAPGANSNTLQADNGARHALLPEDENSLILGAVADGDLDGNPSVDALGDDTDSEILLGSLPGSIRQTSPIVIAIPATVSTLLGRSVRLTDVSSRNVVFEFTDNSPVTISGAVAVNLNLAGNPNSSTIASRLVSAVKAVLLQGRLDDVVPVSSGNIVSLGGTSQLTIDLSNAPTISRQARGSVELALSSVVASYADGQTFTVADGSGNQVVFELQDTTGATPVLLDHVPVSINFATATATSIAQAIADAINGQITPSSFESPRLKMANVVRSGTSLFFKNDDEDGVVFAGPFNGKAVPVPMIVTSTGAGMLDAWFDWNQDGDFADAGEQMLASYPVVPGENTVLVQTPLNAAIGFTMSRIRLSTAGGLESTGVGIGGEVEDYMVEILDGTPPVGVNDTYAVNEDSLLSVNAATGVLSNDSDADGGTISVFDGNPVLASIQVVQTPEHGVLVMNANGSFTYDSDPDYFGPDSFVYVVTDGRLRSLPTTVNLVVNPVNDAPTANPDTTTIAEDETLTLAGSTIWANDIRGPFNENGQTLRLVAATIVTPRGNGESVSVSNDTLSYRPPQNYNNAIAGPVFLVLTIRDGGVAGGSANPLESTSTLTINITPINDAPSFSLTSSTVTVFEDNEQVINAANTTIVGFANPVLAGPSSATDEALSQTLTFDVLSLSNPGLFATLPAISASGNLSFVTAKDLNGSSVVVVQLRDSGASSPAPNQNLSTLRTFTINVRAVNDAPEFDVTPSVNSVEDQGIVQVVNFATRLVPGPATALDELTQTFGVTVTAADPSQFSLQPTIAADGTLLFRTAADVNGQIVVTAFLTDNGLGTPAPNVNVSEIKTFTINVTPVNDAPSFTLSQTQVTVKEDNEAFLNIPRSQVLGLVNSFRMGPSTAVDEVTQTPTFLVSVSAPELFSEQPAIDASGNLTFKTAANKNGRATVVVRMQDSGLGTPAPNNNLSTSQTFIISIDPINDAPDFTLRAAATSEEDQGVVTIPGFAFNLLRGPAGADDESSQEIRFVVDAVDPSAFAVQPTISPDGTLTYVTAADVNSNSGKNLTVTVHMLDNGVAGPAPDNNRSATKTFAVNVNPVNDSPVPDGFSTTANEDGSITITAVSVLAGDKPGPADESSQTLRIVQSERSSDNGGVVVPVFGVGGAITEFRYTPGANKAGLDFFRYVIADNGVPSRSATGTITISINPVNDAPQFTVGPTTVNGVEDVAEAGVQWATNVAAGPANATDELTGPNAQTVEFDVVVDNPALFAVAPTIDASGMLKYTPAKDASGNAVVRVRAIDSGSGVAPNVNTSATVTFTIALSPVNDAPVFTSGGNVSVNEDSGAQNIAWATGIAAAQGLRATPVTASDENTQTVNFNVSSNNPGLFSVQPSIASDGRLTFTPAANAFGTAIITVTAVDSGPFNSPNVNTSAAQTFVLSIDAQNDAPTGTPDTFDTSEDARLEITNPGLLSNDSDVDLPNDAIKVVNASTQSSRGVPVVVNADGSFSYDPRQVDVIQRLTDNQGLTDSFTYQVEDLNGEKSNVITVFINMQGANDAPVAVNDRFAVTPASPTLLSILANDTDVDSQIDERTITIGQIPINGTIRVLQTGRVEYTAKAGFRGLDSFTYTVRDVFGLESKEATVVVSTNVAPVAVNDSASTVRNTPVTINVLRNDSDVDGTLDPSTVQIAVGSTNGTATVNTDGTIRFVPNTGYAGTTSFSYAVADNEGVFSNVAVVQVRVGNSIYQNSRNNLDVNSDGFISPIDALIVLNDLNLRGTRTLPNDAFVPPPFIDVDGDNFAEPQDALIIINYLNRNGTGVAGESEGEGEGESATNLVMMVTPEQMLATVGNEVIREVRQAIVESLHALEEVSILREATVPAVVHYKNGNLSEADYSVESLEDVVESLVWDDAHSKKHRDDVFGDIGDLL